jgi:hypothetical protein
MKVSTDISENLCKLCRIEAEKGPSKIMYFGQFFA